MSLRSFHIAFITLSVLMSLSSGIIIGVVAAGESWAIPGIIASVFSAGALAVYGRRFVRRYGKILPKV